MIKLFISPLNIILITSAAILGLGMIFLLIFIPCRKMWIKKHFEQHAFKKIYSIAFDNDYYLINNFTLKDDNSLNRLIDHILFGEKYIYIINDYFYEGHISGKGEDKSLIHLSKSGNKKYIDNPFIYTDKLINRLSLLTGIDRSMMIGIILFSDDCKIYVDSSSKQIYITNRKYLKLLIKKIESRPLGKINASQLDSAVKAIYNIKKKQVK